MNDEPPLFSGALADVVARYPYNACAYSRALADRSAPFRRQVDPDLHELDEDVPFRFFPHEEEEIQEHNKQYQQHSSADDIVMTFLEPAPKSANYHMQATAIQSLLKNHVKAADVPNMKQLTVTLRQNGFIYGSCNGRRWWFVRQIS